MNRTFYKVYFKRMLDIFFSLILIVILSPLLLIIMTLIRIKIGKKIIFKQERAGLDSQIFVMYKFRTMNNDKDEQGELLPDELRLTKFGKLLRMLSLDELPELLNIFKGDMSFVGPRPLLSEYLVLYDEKQKKRHDVRPGLTGLAQVSGRNKISWQEKFMYDYIYVTNYSFIIDFRIILKTIYKVLKREGISSDTSETVEKFRGNDKEVDL
ncbi:sugar transferase [Enterococcus faecalis]|uniref:Bacterial sugar transferase n=1 Tax=Enterococcus faecalis RP2S-4 TaxID=1244145 RepID=A0ABC9TPJ2_ENTFL|nr:sugar transferase [Enterococcus faecalis]EPI12586.1 bacterial sugar transferase [Enterococcus faecalis RP2S-4]